MSDAAIMKHEGSNGLAVSTPSTRAIILSEALDTDSQQRILLAQYIQKHMREGADFGKIPGTDKPTLLKPGAEKLVDLFRCTPKCKLVRSEEDFDRGFFNYMFRVQLVSRDAGCVLAEGYGSCNSRESRYRWRDAQRKCPACGVPSILASKKEPGFFCWAKKGGCGAKFGANDPAILNQVAGRVENDDVATLANTILKMAKKRALVDGAIALARCSDMFTQDAEDFAEGEVVPAAPATASTATASLKAKVLAMPQAATAPAPARPVSKMPIIDEEPPPPGDEDAPFTRDETPARAPISNVTMSFGSSKGKPLSELSPRDLAWYAKALAENVDDPSRTRFRDENLAMLAAIKAEIARR
jgi:hypothetical protein